MRQIGRNSDLGNARVHGASLNRADHALDRQRLDVVLELKIQRSVLHRFQDRHHPLVHRVLARVQQRLDLVVQIGVPHQVHRNLPVLRRGHHHVIQPVDARVRLLRRQHRLQHHQKTPPAVRRGRRLDVVVGAHDHVRQRSVQPAGGFFIRRVVLDPDQMQIDRVGKLPQQRQNQLHGVRVRRHVLLIDARRQLRRRRQIERQRHILRQIPRRIVEPVLADKQAKLVAIVLRLGAGLRRLIHFAAHDLPNRVGLVETLVVAARIQRHANVEHRLARFQTHRRARRIDQRRSARIRALLQLNAAAQLVVVFQDSGSARHTKP